MNLKTLTAIFIILIFTCLLNSCDHGKSDVQTADHIKPSKDSLVKRGKYLVAIIGCNDCHSPKRMGANGPETNPATMLSGFPSAGPIPKVDASVIKKGLVVFNDDLTATVGPWGITFAANITPDETGIGNWTEDQFKNALVKGKYKGLDGTRTLLPPMPWQELSILKDADVEAIFYYLKSIKPVKNIVPAFIPAGKSWTGC